MDLIVLVAGVASGVAVCWALTTLIPMQDIFPPIVYVIGGLALILWIAGEFSGAVPHALP